jgi:hypothetical protein
MGLGCVKTRRWVGHVERCSSGSRTVVRMFARQLGFDRPWKRDSHPLTTFQGSHTARVIFPHSGTYLGAGM